MRQGSCRTEDRKRHSSSATAVVRLIEGLEAEAAVALSAARYLRRRSLAVSGSVTRETVEPFEQDRQSGDWRVQQKPPPRWLGVEGGSDLSIRAIDPTDQVSEGTGPYRLVSKITDIQDGTGSPQVS
jgi:hypothetical protein